MLRDAQNHIVSKHEAIKAKMLTQAWPINFAWLCNVFKQHMVQVKQKRNGRCLLGGQLGQRLVVLPLAAQEEPDCVSHESSALKACCGNLLTF